MVGFGRGPRPRPLAAGELAPLVALLLLTALFFGLAEGARIRRAPPARPLPTGVPARPTLILYAVEGAPASRVMAGHVERLRSALGPDLSWEITWLTARGDRPPPVDRAPTLVFRDETGRVRHRVGFVPSAARLDALVRRWLTRRP